MTRPTTWRGLLCIALALPLVACAKPPIPPTLNTNPQGCTMRLTNGPQDPFQTPPPLKDACIGPYLLRVPANYFDDQMGPYFDGSFGFALEYPGLQPFAPGERTHLSLDVSTRTVGIGFSYLDRVEVPEWLRRQYTPGFGDEGPSANLDDRIKGELVHGLVPYYADLPKIFDYQRSKGSRETAPVMQARWHDDWFVGLSDSGAIETVIKCTSRDIQGPGVEIRGGKLVRSKGHELPECRHSFAIPELKIAVHVSYVRKALADWKMIEARTRKALSEFRVDTTNGS